MAQVSSGSRIRAQPVVGMVEAQGCSIGISGVSDRRYAAPERLAAMLTAPLCINRSYPGSHVTWPEDATLGIGCGWSSVLQAKKGRKRQDEILKTAVEPINLPEDEKHHTPTNPHMDMGSAHPVMPPPTP
jgi:hypothetical protein